jgi:hypothetical protein
MFFGSIAAPPVSGGFHEAGQQQVTGGSTSAAQTVRVSARSREALALFFLTPACA